jgi:hypothetical protein
MAGTFMGLSKAALKHQRNPCVMRPLEQKAMVSGELMDK